jgi:hypothetical protein
MNHGPMNLLDSAPTRILVFGGILLLVLNMVLGEVFAIFISHVANGEIRERWADVVTAARAGDEAQVEAHFARIQQLFDRRGRIMNTHSHVGAFGMLALLLAWLQPLLTMSERMRRLAAIGIVAGGLVQPLFVFTSHYTGNWAHRLSDLGALLILVSLVAYIMALFNSRFTPAEMRASLNRLLDSASSRLLLRWGALLILLGMLFGLGYAWVFTSEHEPRQYALIGSMLEATADPQADASALVKDYRTVNSRIAILAAVHSHAIEMGVIALLLAFVQSFILMKERTRAVWARTFLIGAYLLPFFIFNATIYGLKSAALADLSGGVVLVALIAMAVGAVRHTGAADHARGAG